MEAEQTILLVSFILFINKVLTERNSLEINILRRFRLKTHLFREQRFMSSRTALPVYIEREAKFSNQNNHHQKKIRKKSI